MYNDSWTVGYTIEDDEGDNVSLDGEDYLTYKIKYTPQERSFTAHGRNLYDFRVGDIVLYRGQKCIVLAFDRASYTIHLYDGCEFGWKDAGIVALKKPVEKLLS